MPNDATILRGDDAYGYGYVRHLSTPQERRPAGGAGVYHHISYPGTPRAFLWIESTPP